MPCNTFATAQVPTTFYSYQGAMSSVNAKTFILGVMYGMKMSLMFHEALRFKKFTLIQKFFIDSSPK